MGPWLTLGGDGVVAGLDAGDPPQIGPYLNRYAGQQLLTGPQAKAYADHFIGVHLSEVAGGKTYAQVSTAAQADPTNTALKAQAATLFQGSTLRGLLLEAYAFSVIGSLALIAAVCSFALAGIMLVLALLGFWHLRKVPETAEVLSGRHSRSLQPSMA